MMNVFSTIVLLIFEGTAVAAILVPSGTWLLPFALSLPIAAGINVLLIFFWTVVGVPLNPLSLLGGHMALLVIALLVIKNKPFLLLTQKRTTFEPLHGHAKAFTLAAMLLIAMSAAYAFSHAVLLPTNQYDSAVNWTMRSKISFQDRAIAFDETEERGMAKPQYPFLFHSLQITVNQTLPRWSDTAANLILFLLSVFTFCSLFSLLRMMRGKAHAVVTLALIVGIPLLGLHTAQGYADLNLIQYLLLSTMCLGIWVESTDVRRSRWLLLSGVFVAAAVWTKSEGLLFGLVPWFVAVAIIWKKDRTRRHDVAKAMVVAVALSVPWPIFAMVKGLALTPHGSDTMFAFHAEGIPEALKGLFARGSFGITWYALALLVPSIVFAGWKKHTRVASGQLPLLAVGTLTLFGFLFVYLCTPNVRYLLNAESYYRQMMLPAALLILGCSLCLRTKSETSENV